MALRDILFGRKQLKEAAPERLFALSTAQVTLDVELGLKPAGAAGVCFKPLSAGTFVAAAPPRWFELASSHPPLEKRLEQLAELSRDMGKVD